MKLDLTAVPGVETVASRWKSMIAGWHNAASFLSFWADWRLSLICWKWKQLTICSNSLKCSRHPQSGWVSGSYFASLKWRGACGRGEEAFALFENVRSLTIFELEGHTYGQDEALGHWHLGHEEKLFIFEIMIPPQIPEFFTYHVWDERNVSVSEIRDYVFLVRLWLH